MMNVSSEWLEFSEGIECQVQGSERLIPQAQPCILVSATIAGVISDEYLEIPCFACSSSFTDFDDYVRYYQQSLSSSIYWCNFPDHDLPHDRVMKLASEFISRLLPPANAAHGDCSPLYSSIVYSLQMNFRNVSSSDDAYDTAVTESFEEAGPTTKPTSLGYISELLRARDKKENESSEWSGSGHECCICIDEIDKPLNSLTLPCLHIFHDNCVLRWLETNHFCPLCRFEMPAQY